MSWALLHSQVNYCLSVNTCDTLKIIKKESTREGVINEVVIGDLRAEKLEP